MRSCRRCLHLTICNRDIIATMKALRTTQGGVLRHQNDVQCWYGDQRLTLNKLQSHCDSQKNCTAESLDSGLAVEKRNQKPDQWL